MKRRPWINPTLLAGVSALAIAVASSEAGAATFDFTGSEVLWTVLTSGLYDIVADGAQGGNSNTRDGQPSHGGLGAEAGGEIVLASGTSLTVLRLRRSSDARRRGRRLRRWRTWTGDDLKAAPGPENTAGPAASEAYRC